MKKCLLIKIGGSILEQDSLIHALCQDIKILIEQGYKIILVHGGSKAINAALTTYGVESQFVNGLRVTSQDAMKIIEMVLCGQVNQQLVRKLNHVAVDAIGLSGAENQLFFCDYYSHEHGFVGNIKHVNTAYVQHMLATLDYVPVIATVGVDHQGYALNINADWAAAKLASALNVDHCIFLTDQDGIYNESKQLVSQLPQQQLQHFIQHGTVTDGMLVKAQAILHLLECGLEKVVILNGKQPKILIDVVLHENAYGTVCHKEFRHLERPNHSVVNSWKELRHPERSEESPDCSSVLFSEIPHCVRDDVVLWESCEG